MYIYVNVLYKNIDIKNSNGTTDLGVKSLCFFLCHLFLFNYTTMGIFIV